MNEDGYTLVEMLAAISILSMLVGGLGECMHLFGRFQSDALSFTNNANEQAKAQRYLDESFEGEGPFWSLSPRTLAGRPDKISYDCGRAAQCVITIDRGEASTLLERDSDPTASVRLRSTDVHFLYFSEGREFANWPARTLANIRLTAISILDGREAPLATVRLRTTEHTGCVFDIVALSCKEGS